MTAWTIGVDVLHIEIQDHELADLRLVLNRALNCWDKAPQWVWDLSEVVEAKIQALKSKVEEPK